MRIVQRVVRGDAHISQNFYALMVGVPIGNGPGRFTHFRQMIKKSPDLLLHPIGHEVHVQVNDAGGPQRLQVSGYGIVCQRRCDQWKLLYTKICECRHHSSDRVHSIMQWSTPVTVLPYQILAVCWTSAVIPIPIAIPTPARPISSPAPCEYIILLTVCATVLNW